ncbi:MAG TPA: EamA family transporter [Herpetosiphonaceae bacterium]|nr:EamA family transporter [Herpetosiphonaceae bacterium]
MLAVMTAPRRSPLRGYALVLTAACLWATIGLFYRSLVEEYNLAPSVVVAFRAGIAAVVLAIGLAVVRPQALRIRSAHVPFFVFFGVGGVGGFYSWYIAAIATGSVAQAAVLLYTAPIWIALWSALHERERLEAPRLLALGLAVAGCALVAQAYDPVQLRINGVALMYGLLAGIGYAIYSVCSAEGTRRGHNPWTVVFFSLGVGAFVLFANTPPAEILRVFRTPGAWPPLIAVALLPTLLAPLCFTYGLQHVRTSSASILATIEPVVAAALAWAFLDERLAWPQIAGGGCVLLAVALLIQMRGARGGRTTPEIVAQPET